MDKNRLWMIGSALMMVLVVALGWVVGLQPQFAAIATANDQRVSVEQTNAGHRAALAKLKEDFKGLDGLNQELATLNKSVPSGTNAPDYVDQLDALANANQVTLKGLTIADAEAYTPVALVAPVAPAPEAGAPAPSPAPTATPTPTAAPGSPPVTNAGITAANFASLSVQITVSGTYSNVLKFVNGLQTGPRLFLVTGLTTTSSTGSSAPVDATATPQPSAAPGNDGLVDGSISGLIYSIVASPAPLAVTGE
ncbi:hypothetical protein E3T23_04705 [Cryobacterium cheniae]|uniref:Uncharacterized protein n=1 Tax=Cryobacterium cheniae TaxID=1259262 RepID=A0A4R8XTS6_9MICO|nr:hypothetical protein [Cryobacterium cheniae]TFC82243.1 hypothetical protein E3T23_04705 [Cryobacterium cheniae]